MKDTRWGGGGGFWSSFLDEFRKANALAVEGNEQRGGKSSSKGGSKKTWTVQTAGVSIKGRKGIKGGVVGRKGCT